MNKEKEFLDRHEVAELCHVCYATVYRWDRQGKIKSYGFGNKSLYKRSEIIDKMMGR